MAKRNGGIIGKVNTPTTSVAKGVWRLQDQYNARKNNIWPGQPYSVDFLVVAGGGGGRPDNLGGSRYAAGGGGAGGYRESTQSVSVGTVITVTVGDGGPLDSSGSISEISGTGLTTITSAGGGVGSQGGGLGLGTGGGNGGSGGGGGPFGVASGS